MMVTTQKRWEMYFDSASRSPKEAQEEDAHDKVVGIGILFVSQGDVLIP